MRFWHDVERPKHKAASDPTARRGDEVNCWDGFCCPK